MLDFFKSLLQIQLSSIIDRFGLNLSFESEVYKLNCESIEEACHSLSFHYKTTFLMQCAMSQFSIRINTRLWYKCHVWELNKMKNRNNWQSVAIEIWYTQPFKQVSLSFLYVAKPKNYVSGILIDLVMLIYVGVG